MVGGSGQYMYVETCSSDEALVIALKNDNVCAFRCLIGKHQDALYRVALMMTGDRIAAMELSTDVFAMVWAKRKEIPEWIPFRYYARHLAHRLNASK